MNQTQLEAVAAGFIQALYESVAVRTSWYAIQQSGNWAGLGALIQETLGLAVTPTMTDIAAMSAYAAPASYVAASPTSVQGEDSRVQANIIFNGAQNGGSTRA